MPQTAFRPSPRRAFALAIGLLLLAVAMQWSLRPWVGTRIPFLFPFTALGVAAMWLGWKPALLVLAGGLVNALFWMEPLGSWRVDSLADKVTLAGYVAGGGILVAMGGKLSQLRSRAHEAELTLSRQVKDLQALQELGSRVVLLPDLCAQLKAILQGLCELQRADKAVAWLYDEHATHLVAAASVGFDDEGLSALRAVPSGQGASGLAFSERRIVTVCDTENDAAFANLRDLARSQGFRAVHSRPLLNMAGEAIGVLTIHFREPHQPSARDNQIGDLCCQMASVLAERETVRRDVVALSRQVEVALESSAVPFCLLTPLRDDHGTVIDFRCEYLNGAAARNFWRDAEALAGHAVSEVVPGAWGEPGLLHHFVEVLERNATVEFEFQSRTRRAENWFHVIASPCEGGLAVWFSDVSDRKRHERMLREADRRKDEFLATLAHELRNPLAPIRQAAMIARSPGARPEQQRWGLEVIDRQVGNMAVLLDDLLDVSRITRGKLELRKAVTNLRDVLDSALEAARPAIEARKQHLTVDWSPTALWAEVDPMRMAQVLSNLLTNASKYTHAEGSIRVTGHAEAGEAVIEVRDNGIGIERDALEVVFEMFTQVRGSDSAAPGMGLGIGLALSRGLAQMHGATLAAQSDGPGLGSTFTLRVALCDPPASQPQESAPAQAGKSNRRVLVADDNRDAAESLAEVLRISGHEVFVAYDGEQALRQYRELTPGIALLDIGMPRMSGNEVAAAIRTLPEGEHAILVAITGWGQERDRAAAKEAGFDFHFTKPVNPEQVLRLIEDPQAARPAERIAG